MKYKLKFPIYALELETEDVYKKENETELILFLEEFWDILDNEFELIDTNGNKLKFDYDYLEGQSDKYEIIEIIPKKSIKDLDLKSNK